MFDVVVAGVLIPVRVQLVHLQSDKPELFEVVGLVDLRKASLPEKADQLVPVA